MATKGDRRYGISPAFLFFSNGKKKRLEAVCLARNGDPGNPVQRAAEATADKVRKAMRRTAVLLSLLSFIICVPGRAEQPKVSCFPDGFVIDEVSSKAKVPGTNVTIETVEFLNPRDPLSNGSAPAFRIGKRLYYLRDSTRPGIPLPTHGHTFFRLGDLLVVSGCEGGSGCNGWLFLLKIEDGALELLDVWTNGYFKNLSYDFTLQPHSQTAVDNGALFRIDLSYLKFSLFVKASYKGLSPVFDPSVYKPFCERVDKQPIVDAGRLRQSCVCRFLLERDKEKARNECRSRIDRYYAALIRKAETFPKKKMTYKQYYDYLSPRLDGDWEYKAIAEAHEGGEVNGRADVVAALENRRSSYLEDTMEIFDHFGRILDAFRPDGPVSLTTCDGEGGDR